MADYFTNFSFVCPLKDDAQKQYALDLSNLASTHRLDQTPLRDDFPETLKDVLEDWMFELVDCEEGILLHSDSGGIDAACAFVQHLLQKFDTAPFVSFEWSHDCSKHRPDAFGGGAAVITTAKIESMNTADWIRKHVPQPGQHLFSPDTHLCVKCGIHADDDLVENSPCIH